MRLYLPVLVLGFTGYCQARQVVLASDDMGCRELADEIPRTNSGLVQKLIDLHGAAVKNATGMKSYMIEKPPGDWW
ncbi:hypothetical protein BGZ72_001851, partial [Mortierella alpina]